MDVLHYTASGLLEVQSTNFFKRGIKWKGMQYVKLRFSSRDKQLGVKKKKAKLSIELFGLISYDP